MLYIELYTFIASSLHFFSFNLKMGPCAASPMPFKFIELSLSYLPPLPLITLNAITKHIWLKVKLSDGPLSLCASWLTTSRTSNQYRGTHCTVLHIRFIMDRRSSAIENACKLLERMPSVECMRVAVEEDDREGSLHGCILGSSQA